MNKATATPRHTVYETDLAYLEEELTWLEARCRRLTAEHELRERSEPDGELSGPWTRGDKRTAAQLRNDAQERKTLETAIRRRIDARLVMTRRRDSLALDKLCALHGLTDDERIVLLIAAAPNFSHKFEEHFENISGGIVGGTTIEGVFSFLELGFADRIHRRGLFRKDAALVRNDLITVDMGRRAHNPKQLLLASIEITARTLSFMVGDALPPDEMMEWSSVEEPVATLEQVVLAPSEKARILSVVENHDAYLAAREAWGFDEVIRYGRGILMLFHGVPGTGKTLTAHGVAQHLGKRVLNVDIPTFVQNADADRFLPRLFQEARLQNAILFFDECETLFMRRQSGNSLMTLLLTEIERFEGVAILATNLPQLLDDALERRILVKVRFPKPDRQARIAIWKRHIPDAAPLSEDVNIEALANRYEITGGIIKNVVLMAVAQAVHSQNDEPMITMAHLEQACRDQMQRYDTKGGPLTVPPARLADVIVQPKTREQLSEVVDAARNRRAVLETWGVGQHLSYGKGIVAMLHGPPGTGKTLAAEAIAGELHRPLLNKNVGSLLSKWVGESERNITSMFAEAKASSAVLFLDECDSLLRTRQSASQMHDHRIVNLLLTMLERHDGLVLLATNMPGELDPALVRRVSWRVPFHLPKARERALIWRRLLPSTVPTEGELDLLRLARKHELSGASIRNAVFKAAFRAARLGGPLTMGLLDQAAGEEHPNQTARTRLGPVMIGGAEA